MRLTVLVIDRAPPMNPAQGNELIARNLFPLLRIDHRLILVAPVVAGEEVTARVGLEGLFDIVRLVPRAKRMPSLRGWFEPFVARLGVRLRGPLDSDAAARFRREIREVLATESIDVVHVRQLPMSSYAADLGSTPRLLELVDSETLAARRELAGTLRATIRRRIARVIERQAIRPFPIVTAVAAADAAALRSLAAGGRVEVIPNGVDAARFRPLTDMAVRPGSVVFVGAMSFPPNVAAVHWFVAEVLPRLRAIRPDVSLTIVGRDPLDSIAALAADPAITVTGAVDDVRPYLARAAAVVAPMVSGSGIKNKVLEAMAMQRPVVATPLAVEGLTVQAGRDLLVADGPVAFAAAVASFLADPAQATSIGAAGRALVEATYTWEACAARYAAIYEELASAGREAGS